MIAVLRRRRGRHLVLAATLAGGIGFFCLGDRLYHVGTGTLVYHWGPMLGGQSVVVWPLFILGIAGMVLAALAVPVDLPPQRPGELVAVAIAGHAVYWASGQVGDQHLVLFCTVVVLAWIGRVALLPHRSTVVVFSLVLAAIGAPVEGLVSALGLFDYVRQDVARVPWWLFAIYLHFGPAALGAASEIRRRTFPVPALPPVASDRLRVHPHALRSDQLRTTRAR